MDYRDPVKRYKPQGGTRVGSMHESAEGGYVKWEDFKALLHERNALAGVKQCALNWANADRHEQSRCYVELGEAFAEHNAIWKAQTGKMASG